MQLVIVTKQAQTP